MLPDSHTSTDRPISPDVLFSREIPEHVRALPVHRLHLNRRTFAALIAAKLETVGNLLSFAIPCADMPKGFDATVVGEIDQHRAALTRSIGDGRDINWFVYLQLLGIDVVPDHSTEDADLRSLFASLPTLIRDIVLRQCDNRKWTILQRRYALDDTEALTLEDLGAAFNVSRQRVRQLESEAEHYLASILMEQNYVNKTFRVHPTLLTAIESIRTMVYDYGVVSERALPRSIANHLHADVDIPSPYLGLLLSLGGAFRIRYDTAGIAPLWVVGDRKKRDTVRAQVERLHNLLTRDTVTSMPELDVLSHLNKGGSKLERLSLTELRTLVDACSSVEKSEDGTLRGRFECLQGRGNQVARLLAESNEAMSSKVLAREINHRLVPLGQRKLSVNNLVNQMSEDGRFVPIGRSGQWALRSHDRETKKIVQLMEECLILHDRPLSATAIYDYVKERRPVSRNSITLYLQQNRFYRADPSTWGLTVWQQSSKSGAWGQRQVADFVAALFGTHKTKRLEYRILKDALVEALYVSPTRAQGFLNSNPVITTELVSGKRYAILHPDYKKQLEGMRRPRLRKKATLRSTIEAEVLALLKAVPGGEMALAHVVQGLRERHKAAKATLYSYISSIQAIETVYLPGSPVKICRLRGATYPPTFPAVDSIANSTIRDNVRRAISHVTEENVDLGLFALGREFETTIKSYFKDAIAHGIIHTNILGNDVKKWRLNDMVLCAKQQGIVTDDVILQILRSERNERAHGNTPPLEERRILLQSAPLIVSNYIDYIKIFDDLHAQL